MTVSWGWGEGVEESFFYKSTNIIREGYTFMT